MGRVNAFVTRRPVVTAMVVTSGKACAADLMIQSMVEKKEKIDRSVSSPRFISAGPKIMTFEHT